VLVLRQISRELYLLSLPGLDLPLHTTSTES
jgi:hypothetical protein